VIDPPWWLVIFPLAAAPVVYFLRRWRLASYLAALVSLLAGGLAWSFPPTNPMRVLGRTFLLDPLTQQVLALLFVTAAILFVAGAWWRQGEYLAPLGLVSLALLAVSGMSRHLGFTAITFVMAAIVTVPLIQAEQTDSTRGAWRFLLLMFFGLPFVLLAAWRVDMVREDPANAVYLAEAALFLLFGMTIWLAVFPLHGWLTGVGSYAPPLAAVYVLTAFPLMVFVMLLHVMNEASWFNAADQAKEWLLLGGVISAAVAGIMAAVQRNLRAVFAYAALFDLACLLIGLAVLTPAHAYVFYAAFGVRTLGLVLSGMAAAAIRYRVGDDAFTALPHRDSRSIFVILAWAAGGLTLAGLPLAAGFAPRWLLLGDLAGAGPEWVWLVLLAGLGVMIGFARGIYWMLLPMQVRPGTDVSGPPVIWAGRLLLAAATLLTLVIGLFPSVLLRVASSLALLYPLPK
jgi:multicomponent Na+:H+ antiporter subunit D